MSFYGQQIIQNISNAPSTLVFGDEAWISVATTFAENENAAYIHHNTPLEELFELSFLTIKGTNLYKVTISIDKAGHINNIVEDDTPLNLSGFSFSDSNEDGNLKYEEVVVNSSTDNGGENNGT